MVDVVAVEDGVALVAGQEHGGPLGHPGAGQVAGGGAPTVVEEAGRHAGRPRRMGMPSRWKTSGLVRSRRAPGPSVATALARTMTWGGVAHRSASHVRDDSGDTRSMAAHAACDFSNAIRCGRDTSPHPRPSRRYSHGPRDTPTLAAGPTGPTIQELLSRSANARKVETGSDRLDHAWCAGGHTRPSLDKTGECERNLVGN